jgi:hypothetical protein
MGIVSIYTDTTGQVNVNPRRVKVISTDALSKVTSAGYLQNEVTSVFPTYPTDIFDIIYSYVQATNSGTYAEFLPSFSNGILTLVLQTATLQGPVLVTDTLASATPGTVRALIGSITNSTLMTSGNIVGVRGVATYVGASGGFIYGTQGKVICTGALTSSEWSAGLFGQLDVSAATINGGQISAIWADWGATGATATSMTGARLYAGTNTTANILNAQMYLYGPATNFLELDDNSGAYGATYFVAAGTSSGSAGDTSKCNASKVLKITMNGTNYWLPLFASNS